MKKRICAAAVICSLISVMSAEAKVLTSLDINQYLTETGTKTEIAVSGNSSDSYVPLAVINPGANEAEADPDSENIKDIYQILKNIKTNSDGTFLYKYTVTDASGEYMLRLGDDAPVTFTIMTKDALQTFFDSVGTETDNLAMAELFSNNAKELNIADFNEHTVDKEMLGAAVIADRPFENVGAAVESYKKNAAALALTNIANKDNYAELSKKYESLLEIGTLEDYDLYKTFTDTQKTELFEHMASAQVTNYNSFKSVAAEQIVLTGLDYTNTYGEAEELLKKYPNAVNIDWNTKLNGIKDPTSIFKGLSGNYYKSVAELSNAVDILADKQRAAENEKNENVITSGNDHAVISGGISGGGTVGRPPSSTAITPAESIPVKSEDKNSFKDMADAEWARSSVEYLTGKGALEGFENGDFKPNDNVTREQFVKTVVAAFEITGSEEPGFLDTDKSAWYYDSICIAYKNKIVMGIDDTSFGIGNTLTREEMAVFAYRAAKAVGYEFKENESINFVDGDNISEYAKEAVGVMSANGIINGFPNGTFGPNEKCTRAQMAVVIASILKNMN